LIIEVADMSLRYDRDVKVALYARHGITEVWLVDVRERRLTRYRDPVQGAYTRVDQPDVSAPIDVGALADVRVELGAIFAD
jgi:Uma2 family endonuclease